MAARRLIIVLLVLMTISTIAAILAPPIEERRAESAAEREIPEAEDGVPENGDGTLREERVDASARPAQVGAVAGDRLSLTVASPTPTNVQIPGLGLSGFADRGAPALFDFAVLEQAVYRVERDDGSLIATIEVRAASGDAAEPAERKAPAKPAG